MAKYRLLTIEELHPLEKDFVEFLIINGITASDWEILKSEDLPGARKIVELFSDVVFEKIFRKVEFLEYRGIKEVMCFQCLKDKLVLVGIKSSNNPDVDFTNAEYINQVLENPSDNFNIYTTEKEYSKQRELELFDMTQAGCSISDGKLFKTLCLSFPIN